MLLSTKYRAGGFLKASCIKEEPEKLYELVMNDPTYREMNGDTYELIAQHTKANELMQVKRSVTKDDMEVLNKWHKSAARAATLAEFEANM